ncbi:MAG: nuclear transport factor 2 family protein [Flavobacteriales bacterium]|nr:nuclear transport factor 2 family protein [Flavobacteriales bacterium]
MERSICSKLPSCTHDTRQQSHRHKWFAAFNAHDLDALLALYKDDAEHYSPKLKVHQPKTNGWVRGKKALRGWWQDAFDRLPELRYEVMGMNTDEEQVFMEYIRHVPGEDDLRVGEVLEIRDGMIVGSRVYHG